MSNQGVTKSLHSKNHSISSVNKQSNINSPHIVKNAAHKKQSYYAKSPEDANSKSVNRKNTNSVFAQSKISSNLMKGVRAT